MFSLFIPERQPFLDSLNPNGMETLEKNTRTSLSEFQYDAQTGAWTAVNYDQRMGFRTTDAGGITITNKRGTIGMQFAGICRDECTRSIPDGTIHAEGTRLEIGRGADTEWYVNRNAVIEQGMTISARPEGTSTLRVSYALSGDLQPQLAGETLLFFDSTGPVLQYGGLSATDATGRALPARLALSGTALSWQVDDRDAVYPITIDPTIAGQTTVIRASPPPGEELSYFGGSVSFQNDTALIGAYNDEIGSMQDAGQAYIFSSIGGAWSQVAILNASDKREYANFGKSVSVWNDTAVVGASEMYVSGNPNRGQAYVFKNSSGTWSQTAILSASDGTDYSSFGWSVAVWNDTILSGSKGAIVGVLGGAGQVYSFKNNGGTWSQTAILSASDAAENANFGYSVYLVNDTALIGAIEADGNGISDAGQAYIFKNSGGTWSQTAILNASDAQTYAKFGWSVGYYNDTAVIGSPEYDLGGKTNAGQAYVFKDNGTAWNQVAILNASDALQNNNFGKRVSVYRNITIVGSPGATVEGTASAGKAYIFNNSAGTWTQSGTLTASDTASQTDANFGEALSLMNETMVLVGASSAKNSTGFKTGQAYIITLAEAPAAPVASFDSANVSVVTNSTTQGWAGFSPLTMQFTDTSTNTPTSWKWVRNNLTDTSWTVFNTSQNARDSFWIGNWTVNLTATNTGGSNISSQTLWVNVSQMAAPVAGFTSANVSVVTNSTAQGWAGGSPLTMQFTDTSTNTPTSWKWARNNLTDTSWTVFNTSQNARDSFWIGNWTVNLTATNAAGSGISSQTLWVNISQAAPTVTGITPSSEQNTTTISITNLAGTGFYGSPTVNLTKAGQSNITATGVTVVSASKITCTFDLTSKVVGTWNVNVTNPDGQEGSLVNGFTVTNSSAAPVATFTGNPLSGTAPLAVTFTDTSTGTPTRWIWDFGDGNTSAIQSPAFTYVTSGYFTVKLNATNAFGSNTKTASKYISVAAVSRQNSTENANITQTISGGQTNVNVSTCDPGMTVTNTTTQVLVTNPALGWQKFTFDGANIRKNACYVNISVSNVTMDSTPFTAPLPGLGTVSTSLIIGQNQSTSGTLQQEIITGANTTVTNAFQLAATNNGLTLGNIAYTLQIGGAAPFNRNLTTSGVIINMSASHTWVLANGGTGAIRIFRYSDTGVVQMLPTTFVGTDAGSVDYFIATSVNGFSEFGLGGTSTTTTPGSDPSGGGGGSMPQQSGQSGSGVAIAREASAGQTVSYSFGNPSTSYPVSIQSVSFVPDRAISQSQCVVQQQGPSSAFGLMDRPAAYESIEIYWINPAVIKSGTIHFSVLGSWLRENHIDPANVVLLRSHDLVWAELTTMFDHESGDVYYYSSTTPGFSYFAVSEKRITPADTTTPQVTVSLASGVQPAHTVAGAPGTTMTTKPVPTSTSTPVPAPLSTEPLTGIPVVYYLAGMGIAILLIAGFFIGRRLWWARQNPSLFKKDL